MCVIWLLMITAVYKIFFVTVNVLNLKYVQVCVCVKNSDDFLNTNCSRLDLTREKKVNSAHQKTRILVPHPYVTYCTHHIFLSFSKRKQGWYPGRAWKCVGKNKKSEAAEGKKLCIDISWVHLRLLFPRTYGYRGEREEWLRRGK